MEDSLPGRGVRVQVRQVGGESVEGVGGRGPRGTPGSRQREIGEGGRTEKNPKRGRTIRG
ncbi:hypothetical protein KFK09_013191 [Dendrobium nobile]|uniref:Uncharacterized protein n=1 Tax=Dendrobium nobile TaxID=94219 RepID=A0A8T3B6N9_DENNO|nr:hypothetical protein KFK09_013191 [Dendrobium nobile]